MLLCVSLAAILSFTKTGALAHISFKTVQLLQCNTPNCPELNFTNSAAVWLPKSR